MFLANLLALQPDIEQFLADWYGPRARGAPEVPLPVPAPLRRLYDAASRWPDAVTCNDLLVPDEYAHLRRGPWATLDVVEGKARFYHECQGVYTWATLPEDVEDAPVWGRFEDTGPWVQEEPPLSLFVLQLLVFEAALASPHGASAADLHRSRLPAVLAPLRPLPKARWRWPEWPSELWAGDDVVVAFCPNLHPETDEYVSVFVGARSPVALAWLEALVDDAWEHFSPWDAD